MLGEFVEFSVAETRGSPIDVESAHHRMGEIEGDITVTDSVWGFGRPESACERNHN